MPTSKLLPELAAFKWVGRETYIVYDSDIIDKPRVQEAENRLSERLMQRGASVRLARLPQSEDIKVGLDDYLLEHEDNELEELLNRSAVQSSEFHPPRNLQDILKTDYPDTEWILNGIFLKGEVNLLYGDGGVGKSLLALHLAIYVAQGKEAYGLSTIQMPVLALFAEDGEAEVRKRASIIFADARISESTNIPLFLWCQPKGDTMLAEVSDTGEVTELPRLHYLRAELDKIGKPALVILDSLADLFAMNEILRPPVNAAMKRVLGSLCRDYGATIIVLAHPSKASMQDGSYFSGSTAFNNAVRQRVILERDKAEADFDGPKQVTLRVAKSNYGSLNHVILLFDGYSICEPRHNLQAHAEYLKSLVLKEAYRQIDQGTRIVKANGNYGDARTLRDFTEIVNRNCECRLSEKQVRAKLIELEEEGLLEYQSSQNKKRPFIKAGYIRGTGNE